MNAPFHPLALTHAYRISRRSRRSNYRVLQWPARLLRSLFRIEAEGVTGVTGVTGATSDIHPAAVPYTSLLLREQAERSALAVEIPGTFSQKQGEGIMFLKRIHERKAAASIRLLNAWAPTAGLSRSQIVCIEELLRLEIHEFHTTLADALEPGDLRNRLRALERG